MATKPAATSSGRTWKTARSGNHFSMTAKRMRPTVTAPQKTVRASEACVVLAPSSFVM